MLESLFVLYLISGFLKGFLKAYGLGFPVDLTLLSGIVVLVYCVGEKLKEQGFYGVMSSVWKGSTLLLLLGGFVLYFLLSTFLWTPSEGYAYWKCMAFMTNVIAFAVPLIAERMRLRFLVKAISGFAILFGGFTFLAYGLRSMGYLELLALARPDYLEGLYLQAGLVVGVAAVLVLYLGKRSGALLLNLSLYLLLATAARGAIFFLLTILVIIAGYYAIRSYRESGDPFEPFSAVLSPRKALVGILANGFLILLIFNSVLLSSPYERTFHRFNLLFEKTRMEVPDESGGADGSGKTAEEKEAEKEKNKARRLEEYRYAVTKIFDGPLPFTVGYGFGSFNLLKYGTDSRGYPHNVFLEIWFELGIIGVILALSFLGFAALKGIRMGNLIFLFAVLFFLMNSVKSYSVVDFRLMFGLLGVAAFIPPCYRGSNGGGTSEPPSS